MESGRHDDGMMKGVKERKRPQFGDYMRRHSDPSQKRHVLIWLRLKF